MNQNQLGNWLKDKPRDFGVAIASRAALRVAVILPWDGWSEAKDWLETLTFTSLRCLLLSSLASVHSIDDETIIDPAYSSARSAVDSAYSPDSAAFFAPIPQPIPPSPPLPPPIPPLLKFGLKLNWIRNISIVEICQKTLLIKNFSM